MQVVNKRRVAVSKDQLWTTVKPNCGEAVDDGKSTESRRLQSGAARTAHLATGSISKKLLRTLRVINRTWIAACKAICAGCDPAILAKSNLKPFRKCELRGAVWSQASPAFQILTLMSASQKEGSHSIEG